MEIGVGDDGAAGDFVEGNVLGGEVGRTGNDDGVAHAVGVLQCPAQGLHATQAAPHDGGKLLDAKGIEQAGLGVDPVFHGDDGKIGSPSLAGGRVGVGGAGRAKAGTEVVDTNHKEVVGIDGFAGADHVVPPTFAFGDGVAVGIGMHTSHVVRGVKGMANEDGVGAVGI